MGAITPSWARAKVQSGTNPLRESIRSFTPDARCDFQYVIGDFMYEDIFFILVADYVSHVIGQRATTVAAISNV